MTYYYYRQYRDIYKKSIIYRLLVSHIILVMTISFAFIEGSTLPNRYSSFYMGLDLHVDEAVFLSHPHVTSLLARRHLSFLLDLQL